MGPRGVQERKDCTQENSKLNRPRAKQLGSDGSRGYRLEMICADFLAGAPHLTLTICEGETGYCLRSNPTLARVS